MNQPEESREKTPKTDAILQPPTANPERTQVEPGAVEGKRKRDEGESAQPSEPREEGS
jgi:hypothetical protein